MILLRRSPSPQLMDRLSDDEGLRLVSYRCPTGHITIGRGHNMEAKPIPGLPIAVGVRITAEQANQIFLTDAQAAVDDTLRWWPWADGLSPARFDVLANMVFNMGAAKVAKFRQFLAAIRIGDWESAVCEMYDSAWALQVGDGPGGKTDRVDRLAAWMRSGDYVEVQP